MNKNKIVCTIDYDFVEWTAMKEWFERCKSERNGLNDAKVNGMV
jgi:hypothetical protein